MRGRLGEQCERLLLRETRSSDATVVELEDGSEQAVGQTGC